MKLRHYLFVGSVVFDQMWRLTRKQADKLVEAQRDYIEALESQIKRMNLG